MFADACDKARAFTRPVVTAYQCVDGVCRTVVGSFVVVNPEGWFLTANHIGTNLTTLSSAITTTKQHLDAIAAVTNNKGLTHGNRKSALKKLGKPDVRSPLAWAVWWSLNGVRAVDMRAFPEADLLLGRLDPFDPSSVAEYPSFKDPTSPLRQGTSLCRIGYPFDNLKVAYDAQTNSFSFQQLILPVFPIEGIFTRTIELGANTAGYKNMLLETSSPGLMGQSGGSIVDTRGVVWSIQSRTMHFPLGFDPEVPAGDGKPGKHHRKEYQFLNVGWGAHPETVVGFLRQHGVAHTLQG